MSRSGGIEGLGAREEVTEETELDHVTSFAQCGVGSHRQDDLLLCD